MLIYLLALAVFWRSGDKKWLYAGAAGGVLSLFFLLFPGAYEYMVEYMHVASYPIPSTVEMYLIHITLLSMIASVASIAYGIYREYLVEAYGPEVRIAGFVPHCADDVIYKFLRRGKRRDERHVK